MWLDTLVDFAHSNLGDAEREALWMRGFSDEQIALYRLGCVLTELPELGTEAGPFLKWVHDRGGLQGQFVLPMTNAQGQVRGVQFRFIDRAKKGYGIYSIEEDEPVLFGLGPCVMALLKLNVGNSGRKPEIRKTRAS